MLALVGILVGLLAAIRDARITDKVPKAKALRACTLARGPARLMPGVAIYRHCAMCGGMTERTRDGQACPEAGVYGGAHVER